MWGIYKHLYYQRGKTINEEGDERMRQKIDNPTYMVADEIKTQYKGKWVFITNANYTPHMRFLGGIPVVVADRIYEGHEDGFYDEFADERYSPRTEKDYYESEPKLLNAFFSE